MTEKKKVDWRIVVIAMICMTAAEITALILGHNGTLLKLFLVAMSLMAGATIPLDKFIKGTK